MHGKDMDILDDFVLILWNFGNLEILEVQRVQGVWDVLQNLEILNKPY